MKNKFKFQTYKKLEARDRKCVRKDREEMLSTERRVIEEYDEYLNMFGHKATVRNH